MTALSASEADRLPGLAGDVSIAVIVPAYGHPVFLSEAIESVLAQQCPQRIGLVIISDGCKLAETDIVASSYAIAHPSVVYLRKPNGGPSSARNYGIDYALEKWPHLDAVYFLDSDNRLTPTAIADAYRTLKSQAKPGWVYPNIDSFGIKWSGDYGVPYSPLLHVVYDNLCDTGSLVSRSALEAGVRFDEDARSGYEDWDFWLQCLDRGFRGQNAQFGFSYRQRPESRFREMNRQRGAMVEYLRRRHWASANPRNLLTWEHETNPRYLYVSASTSYARAFTDPAAAASVLTKDMVVEQFCAAQAAPDHCLLWPFFVFGSDGVLDTLGGVRLLHNAISLMERECSAGAIVALTLAGKPGELGVRITRNSPVDLATTGYVALMCSAETMKTMVSNTDAADMDDTVADVMRKSLTEVHLFAPGIGAGDQQADDRAVANLGALARDLRDRSGDANGHMRWNWRPQHFPPREEYYKYMCRYVGVAALPCRLPSDQIEVGVAVPIASFGGAEKVAYAMAQYLKEMGCRVHLFVFGKPVVSLLSNSDAAFDTISFIAEPELALWGGDLTVFGQECFPSDSRQVKANEIAGVMAGLDFIVNCHCQPLNSIIGMIRSQHRAKTATYLHVFDSTARGRSVGHPYLAVAFEHAYDLVLTCSRALRDQVHGLGIPVEKILAIPNAAAFPITSAQRDRAAAWRALPRGDRALRVLYIGRLDPQKGIERVLAVAEHIQRSGQDIEVRVVGGELMGSDEGWSGAMRRAGVHVETPVYDSVVLAEIYGWADILLLPSRWEGAPLVIPECQQLGCIPIATRVGAVEELVTHDVDGILIEPGSDIDVSSSIANTVHDILEDDDRRRRLAAGALGRAETNNWTENFRPLGQWVRDKLPSPMRP